MTEGNSPKAAAPKGGRQRERGKDKRKSKARTAAQARRHAVKILAAQGIENPFPGNGLALLQSIYLNPANPSEARIPAAMAAMPFESPRLATVTHAGNVTVTHEMALDMLDGKKPGA